VDNDDGSEAEDFEERARQHNSNLQRLIEGIGSLIAASSDLLGRLQQLLSGAEPATSTPDDSPQPDKPTDC
jgi:hypothetical protein